MPGWLIRAAAVSMLAAGVIFGGARMTRAADSDAPRQKSPQGGGAAEKLISENCEICHTADLIRQQRLSHDAWLAELTKMRSWGSPLEDDDVKPLAAYLTERYGIDAPLWVPKKIPAQDALALYKPGPSGPAGKASEGQPMYADACASCHGDDALGKIGPRLVYNPVLYRWNDYEAAIMNGRGRMPAFRDSIEPQQSADILAWLRTLNPASIR